MTAAFGALSTIALLDVGYFGIIEPPFKNWGPAQVFTDLVILAVLGIAWMWKDAPSRGLTAWPFIVVTLAAGSFGILGYLIYREIKGGRAPARA